MNNINDTKINYFLDHYLGKIKNLYNPAEVWLWGSRFYGTANEYSDIDLILVSEKFNKTRFIKRRSSFLKEVGLPKDRNAEVVDALCYTPAEIAEKRKQISSVNEAFNKGVRVV